MGRGHIGNGPIRTAATPSKPSQKVHASNTGLSLQTFRAATDDKKAQMLQRAFGTKIDANQNGSNPVQRFYNAFGLADKRPQVVSEDEMEKMRTSGQFNDTNYYFHTDENFGGHDAGEFNDQFRNGRQYASDGYYGVGTYIAGGTQGGRLSSAESFSYGSKQVKILIKNDALTISTNDLDRKLIPKFKRQYPKAYQEIINASKGYSGYGGQHANIYSVVAAHYGYQVIQRSDYKEYKVLLDRSVAVVSKESKTDTFSKRNRQGPWKYYGD